MVAKTKKPDKPEIKAKYILVPTFVDVEIPILDFVYSKFEDVLYINFIDMDGRLGRIKDKNVGFTFVLEPSKEEIDLFFKLKEKSEELAKKFKEKPVEDHGLYT